MTRRSLAILIAVLGLGACAATPPTGRSVVATADKDKGVAECRLTAADCRYPLITTGLLPTLSASGGGHR